VSLHCPFCMASESERVEGEDEDGSHVLLVIFDCPFNFRFSKNLVGSDDSMQEFLDEWKSRDGSAWLDDLGPILKQRELKNIQRHNESRNR